FKMVGAGGASSDRAKAHRQVEALANACEEYRAEYGRYPPVPKFLKWHHNSSKWKYIQPVSYSYPASTAAWTGGSTGGARTLANTLKDVSHTELEKKGAYVFKFGLLSFLVPRIEGHAEKAPKEFFGSYNKNKVKSDQHSWFAQNSAQNDPDTAKKWADNGRSPRNMDKPEPWDTSIHCAVLDNARDLRVAKKIAPLLSGIISTDSDHIPYADEEGVRAPGYGGVWTNKYIHVTDPWGNSLNYKSDPPYESFKVWSNGPDGKTGDVKDSDGKTRNYSADDIVAGNEN
ncbi:MAG: type II secretion system protein GspG, partial [Kiritimatiellae bacterium]|nr:type II secretion system protein GspG [Kiritimatiellia bacterium]